MTHQKYHTQGIVLKKLDRGEADQVCVIFTRDIGLVYAQAKSVRKLEAKLRSGVQTYTLGEFAFIRGRNMWKLTHADGQHVAGSAISNNNQLRLVFSKLFQLILKLVPTDEAQHELFDVMWHGLLFASRYTHTQEDIENLETLLALRILYALGYIGNNRRFAYILASPFVSDVYLAEAERLRQGAIQNINRAIRSL